MQPIEPMTSPRPGLNHEVIEAAVAVDELLRSMRIGVEYPSEVVDELSALKIYYSYITMLVDVVLENVVMSVIHANDVMVLMNLRLLVEYSAKVAYYDANPDYALYEMTIGEAESVLGKLRQANAEPEAIATAEGALARFRQQFSHVAGKSHKRFVDLFMGLDGTIKADFIYLYGGPSGAIHGDPEGRRAFIIDENGQPKLSMTYPIERVNAMAVDAAMNALGVCNYFIGTLAANNQILIVRYKRLKRELLRLTLKHNHARSEESLAAVAEEIQLLNSELGAE